MAHFYYKASDPAGKWRTGEVEGATLEEAEGRLLGQGLVVESLTEAEPPSADQGPAPGRRELAELVEQLAALTRSGLPLPSGLRAAGREAESPALRSAFGRLADLVEAGAPLDAALAEGARRFPPDLRGLIAAGARSGRLAEMLGQYVEGANLGAELKRLFLARLVYPTLLLAFVLAQVGFLCSIAVGASDALIGPTFRDWGGREQPTIVMGLIGLARLIAEHGSRMLAAAAMLAVVTWLTFRFAIGPAARRRLLCSIPVVGPVLRYAALTEFCHRLAMLVDAETPLPLAFELAGSSVRDADVAEACARMGRAVEAGEPLSSALRQWESIPAGLGQLFRWSEDRRSLPAALHLAGDMFEARARSQSSYASQVLSTFLFLLILWWIGFAVAALYMPLFSLIQAINRLAG